MSGRAEAASRIWKAVAESILETDLRPQLARIRCPTLVIWGDRDGVVLRDDQQAMVSGIQGAELKVYEDTGHAVHWEVPDRFVADVQEFLSRKP
jgi:pimeloyl-ACP methyl ester carboxylesterase